MITKGTAEYAQAQKLANKLVDFANTENTNSAYTLFFNKIGAFLAKIEKTEGFASQVAKTCSAWQMKNWTKSANISSKQAWILACCAIENNIEF